MMIMAWAILRCLTSLMSRLHTEATIIGMKKVIIPSLPFALAYIRMGGIVRSTL
jgi:hypothetical protein